MLTAEQLEIRKTGVGGSDMAVVLGLSPHKTKYELYLEKTGQIEPENLDDVQIVQFGNMMEDMIADLYTYKTGIKLRRKNQTVRHPKYPWILANIDRKVEAVKKGSEIKNVGFPASLAWGKDGSDEVAEYYIPQPMTYMLVLDYQEWDVVAYFGGDDLRVYPLKRDPEFDELIIDASHDFWHNHVLAGVPPEIDYDHKSTEAVLKRRYPGTDGTEIDLPAESEYWHQVKLEAAEKVKLYQGVVDGSKNHLLEMIGDSAVGRLPGGGQYSRSVSKRRGFTVEPTEITNFRFKKG